MRESWRSEFLALVKLEFITRVRKNARSEHPVTPGGLATSEFPLSRGQGSLSLELRFWVRDAHSDDYLMCRIIFYTTESMSALLRRGRQRSESRALWLAAGAPAPPAAPLAPKVSVHTHFDPR
jgi:hypothetical protein